MPRSSISLMSRLTSLSAGAQKLIRGFRSGYTQGSSPFFPLYIHTGYYSAYVPDHILMRAAYQTNDERIQKACEIIMHAVGKHMTPYAVHSLSVARTYAQNISKDIMMERQMMKSHMRNPTNLSQIVAALNQTMVDHKRYIHAVICEVREGQLTVRSNLQGADRELAQAYGHVLEACGNRWLSSSTITAPAAVTYGVAHTGSDGVIRPDSEMIESLGFRVCAASPEVTQAYLQSGGVTYSGMLIASERDRYYRTISEQIVQVVWGNRPTWEYTPYGIFSQTQSVTQVSEDDDPAIF